MFKWAVLGLIIVFIVNRVRLEMMNRKLIKAATMIAQYEPPDGLRPAEIGVLCDHKVTQREMVATLFDLKARGYLEIIQSDQRQGIMAGDYQFKWLGKPTDGLKSYELSLIRNLFDGKSTADWRQLLQRQDYAMFLGMFMFQVNQELHRQGYYYFYEGYENDSYLEATKKIFLSPAKVIAGVVKGLGGGNSRYATAKLKAMWVQIKGFELYIRKAEIDRINYHTDPAKGVSQYDELVPYAIALGVENKWKRELIGAVRSGNTEPVVTQTGQEAVDVVAAISQLEESANSRELPK
jgi:hypothetical protein